MENYLDKFDSLSYSNSDGSVAWTGPWEEFGESTNPGAGDWQIVEDTGFATYALEKQGSPGDGVQRLADLEGFSSATLSFDYRRAFMPPGRSIEVQVSSSGTTGPWTTVATISGSAPPVTDLAYLTESVDISAFISAETAVRFHHPSGSGAIAPPMAVYFDNVEIVGDLANRAPVLSGVGDVSGDEGSVIGFTATATDPDAGDTLTFSLDGTVPQGAAITPGGQFSWTPTETQGPGDYTFDIVVTDNGDPALTDTKTTTITVHEINTPPVARNDQYTVVRGETITVGAPGVLGNDDDPDFNGLHAWVVDSPASGTLDLDMDGSFVYTHTGETDASDSFTYRVGDGNGGHATASVTIVVEPPPNRAPIAQDDSIHLDEDTTVSIDVLANDGDPDGDEIVVKSVAAVSGGVVTIEEDGALRFAPTPDFHGTGKATYTIEDGNGGSAVAKVVFVVAPVNDSPYAVADDVVLSGYLPHRISVLANDSDPDGDPLSVVSVGSPDQGQVELDGSTVIFTPPKAWVGTTTFEYVVSDGFGGRSQAAVSAQVTPETQVAAIQLSNDLGTEDLKAEWVDSVLDSRIDLALSPLLGLQLFVKAFFQSLDGIELSIALLGATALVLAGFSLVSRLPMVVPFDSPRYWSAVLVGRESQLKIREKPDRSSRVIYQLRPTTKGIESEPARRLMPRGWIPVETPRGQGWAEVDHLTEQVDARSFIEDNRPLAMTEQLASRLRQRKDISRLVGRRGLLADVGDGLQVIDPETVRDLSRRGSHKSNETPPGRVPLQRRYPLPRGI